MGLCLLTLIAGWVGGDSILLVGLVSGGRMYGGAYTMRVTPQIHNNLAAFLKV